MHSPGLANLLGVRQRDLMRRKGALPPAGSRGPPARPAVARTSARTGSAVPPAMAAHARAVALPRRVTGWSTAAAGSRNAAGCTPEAADWAWPMEEY